MLVLVAATGRKQRTGMWAWGQGTMRWCRWRPTSDPTFVCASFHSSCCSWSLCSSISCHSSATSRRLCLQSPYQLRRRSRPPSLTIAKPPACGQSPKRAGAASTMVSGVQQRRPRPLHPQSSPSLSQVRRRHAPSIATLGTTSGRCSGSRGGLVPKSFTAAGRQGGGAPINCHRLPAFRRVVSRVKKTRAPTIVKPVTIHVSIA